MTLIWVLMMRIRMVQWQGTFIQPRVLYGRLRFSLVIIIVRHLNTQNLIIAAHIILQGICCIIIVMM